MPVKNETVKQSSRHEKRCAAGRGCESYQEAQPDLDKVTWWRSSWSKTHLQVHIHGKTHPKQEEHIKQFIVQGG